MFKNQIGVLYILKTPRSWTFLSSKEPSSKPLVIIKAAPFPSLVGEGQGGVRGEVYKRGFIFG